MTSSHVSTEDLIQADHTVTKRLGHWTTGRRFNVRARHGTAVLDLRSPRIADGDPAADIALAVHVDHGVIKLLLPADTTLDTRGIEWIGRGRVKDGEAHRTEGARRVRLTGRVRTGQIRVQRGGMARLSAMFSRAYLEDLKHAHRHGRMPTVDDPGA